MKILRLLSCLAVFLVVSARLPGQTDGENNSETNPPGTTVIDSDELRMDQVARTAIFTGHVVAVGTNFHMTCEEMTVFFTQDSKIDNIIAKGNVVIIQPGRITHCGQAQYFHTEDKFILTDQPDILDNQNEIQAPEITIYRANQKLETKGHTTTKIINKGPTAPKSTDASTPK